MAPISPPVARVASLPRRTTPAKGRLRCASRHGRLPITAVIGPGILHVPLRFAARGHPGPLRAPHRGADGAALRFAPCGSFVITAGAMTNRRGRKARALRARSTKAWHSARGVPSASPAVRAFGSRRSPRLWSSVTPPARRTSRQAPWRRFAARHLKRWHVGRGLRAHHLRALASPAVLRFAPVLVLGSRPRSRARATAAPAQALRGLAFGDRLFRFIGAPHHASHAFSSCHRVGNF